MSKTQTKLQTRNPLALEPLAIRIDTLHKTIRTKMVDVAYDIVELGLALLKGKEAHQSDHLTRFGAKLADGVETVSTPEPEGYHKWLADRFPELNDRTARNYVNAALNQGLTAGSPFTAIKDMRKEGLLNGVQLTQLYRPPRQLTNGEPEPQPDDEPNLVRETLTALGEQCDNIVRLRDQLTPKQYEAAIDRLKDALKLMTDCEWNMVGTSSTSSSAASWNSKNGVQRHAAAARAGQKSARAL